MKDHVDGSDISYEIKCIQDVIKQHETRGTALDNCKIYLMSDRKATIDNLKEWIPLNTKCNPVIAKHDMNDVGHFVENGPYAMKGFFEDLALAAYTNGGFIGHLADQVSTASDLIHELYIYNHFVLNSQRQPTQESPIICGIPKHNK